MSTWPTQCGKLVGRRYGGVSGRATDLAQVKSNPQRSYDRPDTGKADTSTCGRIPHRKDGGRGESVRRQGKPQGQPGYQSVTIVRKIEATRCRPYEGCEGGSADSSPVPKDDGLGETAGSGGSTTSAARREGNGAKVGGKA
ncbi:hypothetical protein BHE74_00029827 [Ensete ventricosum]|nr:hypothetical protein BHE74_00029827 [Ensete ventricosum]